MTEMKTGLSKNFDGLEPSPPALADVAVTQAAPAVVEVKCPGCGKRYDLPPESASHKAMVLDLPVMVTDAELTPKAAARSANKLPRAEQLNKFEKDLEAHDSGYQPD